MKKIVIIAGDKSGDAYGGLLSKQLKEKYSQIEIFSFGGKNLSQHSEQIVDLIHHSVSGLVEVISSLAKMVKIFNRAISEIKRINPNLVILIDFPDFNLRIAKKLNKQYPLFYYVSPQIWAWRKARINQIKQYVDKMVVIFQFEQEFYRTHGVDALYFGHPLLEMINKTNIPAKKVISLMPGSRKNEIKKHLSTLLAAKDLIKKGLPDHSFRIIRPDNIGEDFYRNLGADIEITRYSTEKIEESEFIIASSGTATVEIAILGVPYLIIYKVNPITWYLLRRLVDTKYIGMVNILSKEMVVEELLQEQANPENICRKTLAILGDQKEYTGLLNKLNQTSDLLLPENSTTKFAEYIGEFLKINDSAKSFT